jgi:cytochrome b6-f complex iron-sulfur subunit
MPRKSAYSSRWTRWFQLSSNRKLLPKIIKFDKQTNPRYLIVKEDKTLASFGLNAVCTHLGCVVPWSAPNNKFMCPCHGSQYSPDGAVVRGPAPLPLALAHVDTGDDGKILFTPWVETDFRTGDKGWWN